MRLHGHILGVGGNIFDVGLQAVVAFQSGLVQNTTLQKGLGVDNGGGIFLDLANMEGVDSHHH